METYGIVVVIVVVLLVVVLRAIKRANNKKTAVCPRCKGTGEIQFKGEEETCYRCKGTGMMWSKSHFDRRKTFNSWEK